MELQPFHFFFVGVGEVRVGRIHTFFIISHIFFIITVFDEVATLPFTRVFSDVLVAFLCIDICGKYQK